MVAIVDRRLRKWAHVGLHGLVPYMLMASCSRSDIDWSRADVSGSGTGAVGAVGGGDGVGGGGVVGGSGNGSGGGVRPSGGSVNGPCRADSQCIDPDPCTTDRCSAGRCTHGVRDDDSDGYVSRACGGPDCNDRNAAAHPGAAEVCADGADNDCNGVADCFDPACASDPSCGCVPLASGEDCANGLDDDCDGTVDCLDPDCVGTPTCGCVDSEGSLCDNGVDDDCDGHLDCADSDCLQSEACRCRGSREQCSNGVDDDCDLLVDCADPDCAGRSPCDCRPPGVPEVCWNGRDDDCDGQVDCADADCLLSSQCAQCTAEVCDNGRDDDCDGAIDCADGSCYLDLACPLSVELCNNQLDDDFDGLTDCADPDCSHNPLCIERQSNCLTARLIEASGHWSGSTVGQLGDNHGTCGGDAGEAVFELKLSEPSRVHLDTIGSDFDNVMYVRAGSCGTGREIGCDDDSAGDWDALLEFGVLAPGSYFIFIDGLMVDPDRGPDEGNWMLNVQVEPYPPEDCADGEDDDGDLLADCADPDCLLARNCVGCNGGLAPEPELNAVRCNDGLDNDCDGKTDCADPDCSASEVFITDCCNGADDNGNGISDDFNCRCISDSDCPWDQLCYTHTVGACGPPCQAFVGDVCPIEAPGSVCNLATSQCEF